MSEQPNRDETAPDANAVGAPAMSSGYLMPVEQTLLPQRPATARGEDTAPDRGSFASGGGVSGYLHAFRRHWFLAISVGLLGGVVSASAAWFLAEPTYTSSSLIHVAVAEQGSPLGPGSTQYGRPSFEIYKGTQMQLLTSDFVLNAALRKLPNLAVLKKEEDPIRWLAKSLQVEAPPNSEILRVSLTTADKEEAAAIVREVVDAYMREVVTVETRARTALVEHLDAVFTEKETEMRRKRTELKTLAEQLGTGDMGALNIKQSLALQQYGETRGEFARVHAELQRARDALRAKLEAIKARKERPTPPDDIEAAASVDGICQRLQEQLTALDLQLDDIKSKAAHSFANSLANQNAPMRKALEAKMTDRRKQLADRLATAKAGDGDPFVIEAKELQTQVDLLVEREQLALAEKEAEKKEAERFGTSSIDVEMMRADINELEKVLTAVADERQRVKIAGGSQPRIEVIQKATPPTAPDKSSRLQNVIVSGGCGFLAPIALLLWWDVRARRINSLSDISRGLGLTVIGAVPHIGEHSLAGIPPDSRRQRQLQICLDHSIDGIAAKLFLRRDARSGRVVLVSSATRGEGKSTLCIQLAKRLARTGGRTLLIDFDLRKPTLHDVFNTARGPGLSEFLRGESDLGPIVRRTEIDNLSILTAGSPFTDSLGALSNGVTRSLFEKVRDEYEFVVVDGSPILPVVDALLASQHVDAVVLSVRRDVSQAARVQAACEQLSAYGVEEFVAVLTGANEDLYYYGDHEPVGQLLEEKPKPR